MNCFFFTRLWFLFYVPIYTTSAKSESRHCGIWLYIIFSRLIKFDAELFTQKFKVRILRWVKFMCVTTYEPTINWPSKRFGEAGIFVQLSPHTPWKWRKCVPRAVILSKVFMWAFTWILNVRTPNYFQWLPDSKDSGENQLTSGFGL